MSKVDFTVWNIDFSVQIRKLKKERERAVVLARSLVSDNYINLDKFEEHILNTDRKNLLHENGLGEKLYTSEPNHIGGSVLFEALVWSSIHQFCFWYNPYEQKVRGLTSGIVHDLAFAGSVDMIPEISISRRKERFYINKVLSEFDYNFGISLALNKLMGLDIFNFDFFKKKKNLFFMQLIRYREDLGIPDNKLVEFDQFVNPAIDYQVPKMLRDFNIIKYPSYIDKLIEDGTLIQKDSYEELFIRSVTYLALIKIQEKYGYSQTQLDWLFWSTRNLSTSKHHCTITEDY